MQDQDGNLNSRHIFVFLIIAFLLATTIAAVALNNDWQLLATATDTASTSSASGLEIVTSNGLEELSVLRGCALDQVLKMNSGNLWACADDATTAVSGAGAVILDLGDDGVNESTVLGEIAVTGDTNSIFTEPSPDKLLIAVGNPWPTATALAANPTDCGANQFANAIAASGNLTCAQPNFTDLAGTATDAQIPNNITIDLAATATALAANGANCAAASYPLGVDASGASESCTTAFYQTVEDEGGALTQRTALNFTGSGVSCSDAAPRTTCTITSGGATGAWAIAFPIAGTTPVADNATDTLTFISTSGTIGVTGNATNDSLDFGLLPNTIVEDYLNAIDSPNDEECLTYEAPGFEWQTCGGAAGNSFETMNVATGSDPVADSSTDTLNLLDSITISVSGAASTDDLSWHLVSPTCADTSGQHLNFAGGILVCGTTTGNAPALAANGANCAAGSAPLGVDATGAVEGCFDVEEEANIGTTVITGNAIDDQVLLGSGASAATWVSIPDCNTNNRDRLQYDTGTNAFSCDSDTFGTADVAGLDISDDTNLTAGRSLTLTGDDVAADAELYTDTKNIVVTSPTTGLTNRAQFTFAQAATITEVACSVDTGTLTIQLDERARATPNTAGTNVMTSSLVCDTDSQVTTTFSNAGIATDAPVNLQITGISGTPNVVRIHVKYTYDD